MLYLVLNSVSVFAFLPFVPLIDWAEVTHDTRPNFAAVVTSWALAYFTLEIAMIWADAKGWGDCEVGEMIVLRHTLHKFATGFPVFDAFAEK